MIKTYYSKHDVVTMARKRIKNIFATATRVDFACSGGKDSIVLNDLLFQMCQSGEIDKSKLSVSFIDEEAIYPCVERVVKNIRLQWLSIGVTFRWWCIEVKHFNCFNQLSSDESFICWDNQKKDVWIRPRPTFAITTDPLLNPKQDTYQAFLGRWRRANHMVGVTGVRVSESVQRRTYIAKKKSQDMLLPIYDWKDSDVWQYIRNHNLEYPDAYKYMYQVGVSLNQLRISQFFSIDTAKTLVKMCEFYPQLFDKICAREPNAYMAMLYFDTELFRRQKQSTQAKKDDEIDYKKKLFDLLREDWRFESKAMARVKRAINVLLLKYGVLMINKDYKKMCGAIIGGDPKGREMRAIGIGLLSRVKEHDK